jgi:hypothetical protein
LVGADDGSFGLSVKNAVREFQIYASMERAARDVEPTPPRQRYSDNLEGVSVPPSERYRGPISGVVNDETRRLLAIWLRRRRRCPVVVEAWNMAGGQPQAIYVQPATGPPAVAGRKDNMWRHDEIDSDDPRVLVRDFSGYYTPPAGHAPDFNPPHDDLRVIGDWALFTTDPHFRGPRSVPPGHTWQESELLPDSLIGEGRTVNNLTAPELSTFRVVRAASEVECNGYFDSMNAYDNAFISLGPCHWTLGIVDVPMEEGELCGFLAYLRNADPDAFQRAIGFFGVRPDEDWLDANGTPNGQPLFKGDRKYAGWLARPDDSGNWVRLSLDEQNGDHFKTWHWYYRWGMAGRTIAGFRRRMWHMARIRLRDILSTPWGTTGIGGLANLPDGTPVTIGHVFTSERAAGLLLRWHIRYPNRAVEGVADGTQRAAQTMRTVFTNAGLAGNPTTWGDPEEQALVNAIMDFPNWPFAPSNDFRNTMTQVHDWPIWAPPAGNPKRFRLPHTVGPLSVARNSFNFDGSNLPPPPNYDTTP